MAESYYEKMKRVRKEQKQRRTLTGGLGDAGAVRKKKPSTTKTTQLPSRPSRKKGSSEFLPNLRKMQKEWAKLLNPK